ncbi:GntR family transcriptional regulator [Ammoniphilus sp. YIM 78166]|uniref:GntR family transcriptional regulator n=1 Tax=Ammoniphilus sp. YIM 78166 TaxID=1644106 RepID=UPI00106F9075|nr:GntR family transcriptional regulator [Ammoniphilus sp. YIM 78166]
MKLNNSSQNPLYIQLKQIIKEDILRGKYKPGQQLPAESELCKTYGVSRITTRRAITDLVDEGILFSHQGKGTFVKQAKEKRELISVGSFSDLTLNSGKKPGSQILSSSIIQADETLAEKFKLFEGESLLKLHRLLFIDDEPFIIETSYYPLQFLPNIEKHIWESPSTYSILKNRYNIEIKRSSRTLEINFASDYEANIFHCDLGSPLFATEKLSYDQEDRPIHLSYSLYMSNKVIFTIDSTEK